MIGRIYNIKPLAPIFFMKKMIVAFIVGLVVGLVLAWNYIPKPY